MRAGFAGLGRLVRPMVRNLIVAGRDVLVWTKKSENAAAVFGGS
jgi:3-hydroxyisobutyrate dehydrogenase-like beta-hydroxyacid dehydrogenase